MGQSDLYLLLFIHLYISQINPRFGSILTNLMGFIPKQYKDTKKFINKLINKFMFTANYLYLICFTTIYLRQKIRIMQIV